MVGEMVRELFSAEEGLACRFINLSTSASLDEIGKRPLRKMWRTARLLGQVRKGMKEFRPELVYLTPTSRLPGILKDALVLSIVRRSGARILLHFHNKGVLDCSRKRWNDRFYRRFFASPVKVILLSGQLRADLGDYVPENRILICPNGLDIAVCPGEKAETPRLLFLSNLIPSKGYPLLLAACSLLKSKGYDFRCRLVGAPTAECSADSLQAEIVRLGLADVVSYSGPRYGDEKRAILASSDIFVFPTSYPGECFPLVLLEAMAFSLPVVSTCEGAIPDMVIDGQTGFLLPAPSASGLADRLAALITDEGLRERMGAAGRSRYESLYTQAVMSDRLRAIIYEELV